MPNEFRDRGVALKERVRAQVDVHEALDRLHGRRRRARATLAVAGAAAVIAIIVASVVALGSPGDSVGGGPSTTVTTSQAPPVTGLPVTVYLALLDEFVVENEELAVCSGTGLHADLAGRQGELGDGSGGAVESFTIGVTGELIDVSRARGLGLPTLQEACLFELVTAPIDVATLSGDSLNIEVEGWPPVGVAEAGSASAGRQVVYYSRGEQP